MGIDSTYLVAVEGNFLFAIGAGFIVGSLIAFFILVFRRRHRSGAYSLEHDA